MKFGIVVLAFLAALKVGYQDYLARSATSEIIVAAYLDRAISACQRDSRLQKLATATVWTNPRSVKLIIGKSTLDVQLWQVDHSLWNARFKNPYLFITARDNAGRFGCEFDIVHGETSIVSL